MIAVVFALARFLYGLEVEVYKVQHLNVFVVKFQDEAHQEVEIEFGLKEIKVFLQSQEDGTWDCKVVAGPRTFEYEFGGFCAEHLHF